MRQRAQKPSIRESSALKSGARELMWLIYKALIHMYTYVYIYVCFFHHGSSIDFKPHGQDTAKGNSALPRFPARLEASSVKRAPPYKWKHAQLEDVVAFLKEEMVAGRFKPSFPFEY